ncbi:MAG TPA: septal ring lytic transglycosylase RlpA family protein [Acidobacteriaceae bacterium]
MNGRTDWLRWLGLSIVIALNTGCRHRTQTIAVPPPPPSQSSPSNTGVIANSHGNSNERLIPSVPIAPKGSGVVADSPADGDFIRTHTPIYSEEGLASWYGPPYHKRRGANGKIYDQNALTAAHRTLPLNSLIKVTNLATGQSVIIRVTDRGPFVPDRILDLSMASAKAIGVWRSGVARVRIDVYAAASAHDHGGWSGATGHQRTR